MKIIKVLREDHFSLLVVIFSLIVFLSHTIYVFQTHAYPEWDEHKYLGAAIHFLPVLRSPDLNFFTRMLQVQKEYLPSSPPFYPLVVDIPLLIFGTVFTYKIALWINGLFYTATIIGVYLLGREFLSKRASALACFIFAFYGFPLFYLHFVYTETAATAFTVFSLYFFSKSKGFLIKRYVIYFSTAFALGLFTRWSMPVFVVGPVLIYFVLLLLDKQKRKSFKYRILFKNVLIFLTILLFPIVLYYLPNLDNFLGYVSANAMLGASWMSPELRNSFSTHSVVWYINTFGQLTIFFFLLAIVGVLNCFVQFRKYAFLLLGVFVPYIFFTFFVTLKDDRFIVLLYPALALVSASVFDYGNKRLNKIKKTLVFITVVYGTLNFLGASWGVGPMKFSITGIKYSVVPHSIILPMPLGHPRRIWFAPISWPPRPDEGNANMIIAAIKKDWNKKTPPKVLQTFEMSQVGGGLAQILSYEDIGAYSGDHIVGIECSDYKTFFIKIENTDYVMVKNGIIDKNYPEGQDKSWDGFICFIRKFNKVIQLKDGGLPEAFKEVASINIPYDESTLKIYRKTRAITNDEWTKFSKLFIKIDPKSEDILKDVILKVIN